MTSYGAWSSEVAASTLAATIPVPPAGVPTFAQRTRTVSATADGFGTGTDASPWTLKQALEQCQPGMIIGLRAGVYIGQRAMGYTSEDSGQSRQVAWHPRNSGTASQRIVFVAEHMASDTTNAALYTDLRSGATQAAYGWPVFGQMGFLTRPQTDYIDWIGIYSNEDDANNQLWGGGAQASNGNAEGETTIAGCWGRGNHCRFLRCRLIRNGNIEAAGRGFDNKSMFRFENCDDVEVADCYFQIKNAQQSVNNTFFTLYACTNIVAHHSYMTTTAGKGFGFHIKGGHTRGVNFRGLKFYNNRVENITFPTRVSGQILETPEEANLHVWGNLFIGGRSSFTWTTIDKDTHPDGGYVVNGLRYYNNTIVNMTRDGESSGFELEGQQQALPQFNPRNNEFFNNIVYNCTQYMMTNYSTKSPAGLDYISDFVKTNRNCVFGFSKLFRGSGGAGDAAIDGATWASWQAVDYQGRVSDDNSINTDPLFAETVNYTLSAGSPCKTLGRDIYGRYGSVGATIPAGCWVLPGDVVGIRGYG